MYAPTSFGRVHNGPGISPPHTETFTETVAEINVGTAFDELGSFVINPGLRSSFPRLWTVASRYRQYAIRRLRFIVSPNAQTGITGKFVIVPDYSATPAAPANYVEAANVEGNVTSSIWLEASTMLDIKATRATGPRKYVRDDEGTVESVEEYDAATIRIYGEAEEAVNKFAIVQVEYVIDFFVPIVEQTGTAETSGEFAQYTGANGTGPAFVEIASSGTTVITPSMIAALDAHQEINSGVLEPTDDGMSWTVERDGVYCLCATLNVLAQEVKATTFAGMQGIFTVNGAPIAATEAHTTVDNTGGTGPNNGALNTYSELIIPLAKGARVAYEVFTEASAVFGLFLEYASIAVEVVGAIL
jgi:hypothetical protein